MKPFSNLAGMLSAFGVLVGASGQLMADAKPNPYLGIVERNPFGLKDPPPPPVPKSEAPVVPPAKVILTGITSLFGPTRAFLEITEQEPGKPGTVKRPILREGEREGPVEVVSIDPRQNVVHIRNGGQELDVKFEDLSKTASAAPRPVVPGMPSAPPPAPLPTAMSTGAPTIISPASADNSTRSGSVSMFGGQNLPQENSAPNQSATPANYAAMNNGAAPIIASRGMRTPQGGGGATVDPAVQYLNWAAHEENAKQQNMPFPPLPPMPGTRSSQGAQGNQATGNSFPTMPASRFQ
jgi:hypothetical protein